MTRPRHSSLPDLAHRAAKARDVLLMTVLTETEDLARLDHWQLRDKLLRLRAVAEKICQEGESPYPARVTGIDLDDYDDYDKPNEHLSTEED